MVRKLINSVNLPNYIRFGQAYLSNVVQIFLPSEKENDTPLVWVGPVYRNATLQLR